MWVCTKEFRSPFSGNIFTDCTALRNLEVLVNQVGQVGELHAKCEFDISPLRFVKVWGGSSRVVFVFKVDIAEVEHISYVGGKTADIPVTESGSRVQVKTVARRGRDYSRGVYLLLMLCYLLFEIFVFLLL
jgi:hypothetical protein